MRETRYAIVDIETTGGQARRDKITEIAIVLHDGQQIIDTYQTLVNPERYIPYGITELTGITQEMVQDAPRFFEVARDIVKWTENAVFVAHNVRFDYNFLQEEFARLGFTYTRKQLCTVRLSRQAFPGLPSYSLGNLIRHFGIDVNNRHRALDDALATAELFSMVMTHESSRNKIDEVVNLGIKESKLPGSLNLERIHALPDGCGVYYFHDVKGEVVYVGKSINIRKRIAEHFADQSAKAAKLQQLVNDISYELTGSELAALLLESYEIKRLSPTVNRAQRRKLFPYIIHTYYNQAGYVCFSLVQANTQQRRGLKVLSEYPKLGPAKGRLHAAVKMFELCACYSGLQAGKGPCFPYHLKECKGACIREESAELYNERALEAMEMLSTTFAEDMFILDKGRHDDEWAVFLIENGTFQGQGYIDRSDWQGDGQSLRDAIKSMPYNPETNRILLRYIDEHPEVKIIKLPVPQD